MADQLSSPGVLVSVVDESQYIAGISTSTPLIVVATAENKSYQGKTCAGTLESNVLRTITSPTQLLQMYGLPIFHTDQYGNKLHGASHNEYGLLAAFNYLSLGNTVYILRADVDTSFPMLNKLTSGDWVIGATNKGTGNITPIQLGQGSSIPETFTMIYDGVYFQIVGSVTGSPVDAVTGAPNRLILPNRPYSVAGSVKGSVNFTIETGTINFAMGDMFTLSTFYDVRNVVMSPNGFLSSISISNSAMADFVTVTVTQASTPTLPGKFTVRGQYAGYIGSGSIGSAFVNSQMSFMITELNNGKLQPGDTFNFELIMNNSTTFTGFGNGKVTNVSLLPYGPKAENWTVRAKAALDGDITVQPVNPDTTPDGKISGITFFDQMNDSGNPDHVTQTDRFTLVCTSDVANMQFTRSSSKAKDNLSVVVTDNAMASNYTLKAKTTIDPALTGNISQAVNFVGGVNTTPVVDKFKFTLSKILSLSGHDQNGPIDIGTGVQKVRDYTTIPFIVNSISNASQFFGAFSIFAANGWDIENWFNSIYGSGTLTVTNILADVATGNKPLLFQTFNSIDIASSSVKSMGTASISMVDLSSLETNLTNWKNISLSSPTAAIAIKASINSTATGFTFAVISKNGFSTNVNLSVAADPADVDPLNPAAIILSASINGGNAVPLTSISWDLVPSAPAWSDGDTFSLIIRPQVFVIDPEITASNPNGKTNYINVGGASRIILSSNDINLFDAKVNYPTITQLVSNISYNTYFGYCKYTVTDVDGSIKNITVCNTTPRSGTNTFTLNSGLQFTWQFAYTAANPYPNDYTTVPFYIGSGLTFIANGAIIGSMNNLVLTPVIDEMTGVISTYNVQDSMRSEIEYVNSYIHGTFDLNPSILGSQMLTVGDTFNMSEAVNGFDVSANGVIVGEVTAYVPYQDNPISPTITISINAALLSNNPYLATDIYSFQIAPSSFRVISLAIGDLTSRYGKAKIGTQYNYNSTTQKYGDAPVSFMITQGNAVPWQNGDTILFNSLVNTFSVIGSISGDHGVANETDPGVWDFNNDIISFKITQSAVDTAWVAGDSFIVNIANNQVPKYPNTNTDAQKRAMICAKLVEIIRTNTDIRSDNYLYSLAVAPGYHDNIVINALLDLDATCRYEFGICSHTPYWLNPEQAQVWANTGERARDWVIWYAYAHGLSSNVDGSTIFVDGTTTSLLQIALADLNWPVWFAPMGSKRGKITTLSTLGYVSGELGTPTTFIHTPVNEQQRGLLYQSPTNVNPASEIAGKGILMMGQKTSQSTTSALDRINVSRLVILMKRDIRFGLFDFISDPNDSFTRSAVAGLLNDYCADKLQKRALYDYLVICDGSNNTNARIDNNQMWADVIIKPTKAAEFIYVPLHVRGASTGMSL